MSKSPNYTPMAEKFTSQRLRQISIAIYFMLLLCILWDISSRSKDSALHRSNIDLLLNKKKYALSSSLSEADNIFRGILVTRDKDMKWLYDSKRDKIFAALNDLKACSRNYLVGEGEVISLANLINKKVKLMDAEVYTNKPELRGELTNLLKEDIAISHNVHRLLKKISADGNIHFAGATSLHDVSPSGITLFFISTLLIIVSSVNQKSYDKKKKLALPSAEMQRDAGTQKAKYTITFDPSSETPVEHQSVSDDQLLTIVHEIRNPLSSIFMACDQIEADQYGSTSAPLVAIIKRNSHRINSLVTNLLNTGNLNVECIQTNTFLDAVLEEVHDRSQLSHVQVRRLYKQAECCLKVDVSQLKIAILNIIVNGIEAMSESEQKILTVGVESHLDHGKIVISDSGRGMDEFVLNRIFEPHFTCKVSGTGMGMHHTKKIILQHGGSMEVKSAPGLGTTFIITLPICNPGNTSAITRGNRGDA